MKLNLISNLSTPHINHRPYSTLKPLLVVLESLHRKLSIFSYFVLSFHMLELQGTSRRHLLLSPLYKSLPEVFQPKPLNLLNSIWIHSSQVSRTVSVLLPMPSFSNLWGSHQSCHIPEYGMSIKIDSNRAILIAPEVTCTCKVIATLHWIESFGIVRNTCQGRVEVIQNVNEACSMASQK